MKIWKCKKGHTSEPRMKSKKERFYRYCVDCKRIRDRERYVRNYGERKYRYLPAPDVIKRREQRYARKPLIVALRKYGLTLDKIGSVFGITKERVRQVLNKEEKRTGEEIR